MSQDQNQDALYMHEIWLYNTLTLGLGGSDAIGKIVMKTNMSKQSRKILIKIAQRKRSPGTGSHLSFLKGRTTQMMWPDLTSILSPIQWAVVGAVATRLYMPERMTQDLDIVIRSVDGLQVRQKLAEMRFIYQGELSIGGSSWTTPDGELIDILEGDDVWWAEAIADAQANRDAQGLPIIPLPYLVLIKLRAGRVQDIADVTRMLGQAGEATLDTVRTLFAQHAPEDMQDLESLIELGRLELQPVGNSEA